MQTWSEAVDVSRAMNKKLENLWEAWSEALLSGACVLRGGIGMRGFAQG